VANIKGNIPKYFITAILFEFKEGKTKFTDNALLLINTPRFKSYINSFRKERGINCKEFIEWMRKTKNDFPLSFKASNKYAQLKETKIDNELLVEFDEEVSEKKKWIDKQITSEDLFTIQEEFDLPASWEISLFEYIFTKKMSSPAARCFYHFPAAPLHKRTLSLKCVWDTSIDDIRNIWKEVKRGQTYLPESKKKCPDLFIEDNNFLTIKIFQSF